MFLTFQNKQKETKETEKEMQVGGDYFCVDEKLKNKMMSADILNDVFGSDHCPVVLEVEDLN